MIRKRDNRRWLAASCLGLASFAFGSTALAADGTSDRHPRDLLSPAHKPAGVPSEYVLTHSGFFHPSCVVTVGSDEVVGSDLVIRGMDGSEHARFAPCAYPRYSVSGLPVPHAPAPAPVTYDGYIVYYTSEETLPSGTALSTQWTVPLAPTDTVDQDIAFFNDIVTTAGGGDILQPVLDYNGEVRNHWAIESEHCCISGDDMQTTPIDVNAGDVILGTVNGTGCDSTGACSAWTVTTADVTTSKSTTLNTTAPMGVPNGVSPGSLETYGVSACDMFPASGEITFVDNSVMSGDGGAEKLRYTLLTLQGVAAEVPRNCGYGGSTSGNTYTLIFGTPSAASDGGGVSDASAVDGSDGGSIDASAIDGSDGGSRDASGDGAGGGDGAHGAGEGDSGTPDDSPAEAFEGPADVASVDSAAAMDSGTGTPSSLDAGSSLDSGSLLGAGGGVEDGGTLVPAGGPESSSGCGCTIPRARDDFGAAASGVGLLLLAGRSVRRRRVRDY